MSIELMCAVYEARLYPRHKFILLMLADSASPCGQAVTKVQQLAAKTGYSEFEVKRTLNSLVRQGLIDLIILCPNGTLETIVSRKALRALASG